MSEPPCGGEFIVTKIDALAARSPKAARKVKVYCERSAEAHVSHAATEESKKWCGWGGGVE